MLIKNIKIHAKWDNNKFNENGIDEIFSCVLPTHYAIAIVQSSTMGLPRI